MYKILLLLLNLRLAFSVVVLFYVLKKAGTLFFVCKLKKLFLKGHIPLTSSSSFLVNKN